MSLIFKWNNAAAMNRSLIVGLNHVISSNHCFGLSNIFEENYTMNYSFFQSSKIMNSTDKVLLTIIEYSSEILPELFKFLYVHG